MRLLLLCKLLLLLLQRLGDPVGDSTVFEPLVHALAELERPLIARDFDMPVAGLAGARVLPRSTVGPRVVRLLGLAGIFLLLLDLVDVKLADLRRFLRLDFLVGHRDLLKVIQVIVANGSGHEYRRLLLESDGGAWD